MKKETIEEFLARGGKIITHPRDEAVRDQLPTVNSTTMGPANILTYGEADLYYGEVRPRRAKKPKKTSKPVDFSILPEAIRNRFMTKGSNDE